MPASSDAFCQPLTKRLLSSTQWVDEYRKSNEAQHQARIEPSLF